MAEQTRRRFLRLAALAGGAGLAGCSGGPDADGTDGTVSPTPTPTETPYPTVSPSTPTSEPTDSTPVPPGYDVPEAPAFDSPDEVAAGYEVFRGVPFRETPSGTLRLDLHRPADAQNPPLVVHLSGGGWLGLDRETSPTWDSSRGWAMATIDYRVARMAEFPAAVRDAAAAVTWLRNNADPAGLDAERLVLHGSSAGGHLVSLLAMARDDPLFAPHGMDPRVADIDGVVTISAAYDFRDVNNRNTERFFGCSNTACPETYRKASPIVYVDGDDPQTLLWHGGDDQVVAYEQALEFRDALDAAGVDVTALLPEDAGHVSGRDDFWQAQPAFLADVFGTN
jgi:acetyl esterase/lipase